MFVSNVFRKQKGKSIYMFKNQFCALSLFLLKVMREYEGYYNQSHSGGRRGGGRRGRGGQHSYR